MADGLAAFELPPGTIPVVRNVTAAGTGLGPVPAGARWIILSAWVSCVTTAATTGGTVSIDFTPSFDSSSRSLVGVNMPAATAAALSQHIPSVTSIEAGQTITFTVNATAATVAAGISGYQEAS